MTNNESELDLIGAKPLAFNLELLRQNYGKHVLTQEDLATMTGVPRLRLSRYERLCDVPAVAALPGLESCNGLDDDCDGQVDEGDGGSAIQEQCYDGPAGTLNVGVCRAGTKICADGVFGACEHEVAPSAEVCDQLDNDCNGTADNGILELGSACGTGQLGRCSTGHVACSALGAVCTPDFAPGAETCNGIDDDCDGAVDDGTGRGDPCTSGLGECTRSGVLVCAPNGQTACNAVPGAPAATDTCDGRDDNCDGVVDDGCPVGLSLGNPLQGPLVGPGTVQNAYRVFCPGGQVIRGFYVDPDAVYNLDGFIPRCGLLSLNSVPNVVPAVYETVVTPGIDGPTVGSAVNGSNLICPAGQVVTGFSGKTGSYGPNRVTFNCSVVQPLSPGNNYTPHVVLTSATGTTGADGANVFAYDCPRDTVLAGVYGQTYPVSNLATRQILGDPFVPDLLTFRYIGLDFSVDLEYSIVQLHHEVTRVQDGRLLTIQNYAIINRERELVAVPSVGSDGMLSTDYVLITRVPRTVQRASATTYAALHGPGIRSIEKFLFELDKSDLDFIQSRIGDSECYQIILKVEDLRVVGNTTIPFNLTCDRRESCAPRGLRLKFV